MGFGGLIVTNVFAYRSTDPDELYRQADPVGEGNDAAILLAADRSGMTLCAWGEHARHRGRSAAVRELLAGRPLHALKVNASGEPGHPLYLSYKLTPTPFAG